MSTQVAREYATNNARAGFRDFATAENGAYGMAWGYATHVEARQAALARCRYYIRDRAADLPAVTCCLVEWRKRDIQRRQ